MIMLGLRTTILISGCSSPYWRTALSMSVLAAGEYLPLEIWKSGSDQCSNSFFFGGSPSLGFVDPEGISMREN